MHHADTICALSTPPGPAPRAILRLSGPDAHAVAPLDPPPTRPGVRATTLILSPDTRLPVLVARFDAPRSFTGEDAIEILLPAGSAVVARAQSTLLSRPGVRQATAGEFSARAFLAGRLTIDQAQGLAAMLSARTEAELRAARDIISGRWLDRARPWCERLANMLALVEAGIDFSDQDDVVAIARPRLLAELRALAPEIGSARTAPSRAHDGGLPVVTLLGRPNAGKSTLFNAMLGRERAVTSDAAGTTRDALAEGVDLGTLADGISHTGQILLVDLPGLDDPDGAIAADGRTSEVDREAQARARDMLARARVVIHCDPDADFDPMAPASVPRDARVIRVRTKGDRPAPAFSGLSVCALDAWNLDALARAIADALGEDEIAPSAMPLRVQRTLAEALAGLARAIKLVDSGVGDHLSDPELIACEMRLALDALGDLGGAITPDEVIGRVFASFCVGK